MAVMDHGWTFDQIIEALNVEVTNQLPAFRLMDKWKSVLPEGGSYLQLINWYSQWTEVTKQLGGFVTTEQITAQFDVAVNRVCPKAMEQILTTETKMQYKLTLEERWAHIEQKARVREQVNIYQEIYRTAGDSQRMPMRI